MKNYMRPSWNARTTPPGSPFQQPAQIVLMLRCTACKRKVAHVTSDGDLEWWNGDRHEACGVFDFESVRGLVTPPYRKYGKTGEQQPAVKITPLPHGAC
ncbi:hypothetical protein GCM10017668_53040 [Streptomyces tuirus]|uniref:Uncharacterized protein n=1 Tax=Streptomyces tuirus TaxID=68278 RepID=A0A7G1NLJ4_9ACTN|nr:hypothetical protein GCM10017668_53040 [Streptomyces tuirus]